MSKVYLPATRASTKPGSSGSYGYETSSEKVKWLIVVPMLLTTILMVVFFVRPLHRLQPCATAQVGCLAPDFTATEMGSGKTVRGAELRGKPTVLLFGSRTCGMFCSTLGNVENFYKKYHDRANIYIIYQREAHPMSAGPFIANANVSQRREAARAMIQEFGLHVPVLVDNAETDLTVRYPSSLAHVYMMDASGEVLWNDPSDLLKGLPAVSAKLDQLTGKP